MRLWALFLLWMPILGWCQEEREDAQVCFAEKLNEGTSQTCVPADFMDCFENMAGSLVKSAMADEGITVAATTIHGIQDDDDNKKEQGEKYDVIVARGDCDPFCGNNSYRTISFIKCQGDQNKDSDESDCFPGLHTKEEKCEDMEQCKPKENFGPWGCWSECSKKCIERADEPSLKTRSRVCLVDKKECAGQLVQTQACKGIPECTDKVICPDYTVKNLKNIESKVHATLSIALVKLQYGELKEQSIALGEGEDLKHIWNEDDIKRAKKTKNQQLEVTFTGLKMTNTYFPNITYRSSLLIQLRNNESSQGNLALSCQTKEFSTNEFRCIQDDPNSTISSSQVCDHKNDCPEVAGQRYTADEDPKLCQGEFMTYVTPGVGIYVFLGIVAYIGTRRLGTSSEKSSGEERSLNSFGEIEENKYEEVEIDERAEHFSSDLITIFTTKRTWNNNDLDDDEKKVITDEYLKLKQNGKIHFAYEHLKASADAPTIEVVMKFLLKLEKRNNQFTNEKPVYLYIMENIPSDNPELKEWIFNHFEQGMSYQLKKYAKIGFPFLVGPVAFIAHYVIPLIGNLYIVFSSYFELFKDIIFFLVIRHFDRDILQHRYEEVGGINLLIVSWYILAVACGSYIAIGIHHFTSKNTMKVYLKQTDSPVFFRAMTAFFPVHFASFESIRLAIEKEARSKELKQFYATFNARQDELDARVLAKEYSQLYNNVKATTDDTVAMTKVQNSVRTWETVIEHVPTSITIISLLIVSIKYQRIRVFMESTFQRIVAKDQFAIIFAIIAFLTLTSIVTTVMSIRNAKRLPLKPTLIGSMTQPLMILVLLTPKVFLASMAFTSMPYFFPIALLLEFLIIVVYNKANFGDFHWFSASTLATLCTPALYSIPGDDKDCTGTKSLEADRDKPMLAKYGKFGHTIVLYNLTGLVYVIGFILINNFADEKVEALANTFKFNSVEFSLDEVFYIVLGSYFAAPLVYGILLYIYYGFGHNYSVFITNKNAMHGEMNAFAETANFETRNVLFEEKAMKPAMPAMSAKPQNVYATAL